MAKSGVWGFAQKAFEFVLPPPPRLSSLNPAHLDPKTGKVRRGPRLKDGKREPPSLAQREAYSLFVKDLSAFPTGKYAAQGCGCRVEVRGGIVFPSACRGHPGLVGAVFELPAYLVTMAQEAAEKRRQYNQLPLAPANAEEIDRILSRAAIPWRRVGLGNPWPWQGRRFTLDDRDACGCTFTARRLKIKGEWGKTRSWSLWYAVRVGSCKKGKPFCKSEAYPLDVKLGVVLRQGLKNLIVSEA